MLLGLTIDNGGSQLRCKPEEHGGGIREEIPNSFVTIETRDFRIKEVDDALLLCNFISAPIKGYEGIIATGKVGAAYVGNTIHLDNTKNKTANTNYYRQLLFAIAHDAMKQKLALDGVVLEKIIEPEEKKKGIFNFGKKTSEPKVIHTSAKCSSFEYVLCTCIPIKEHSGVKACADTLKEGICGTYTVIFPLIPGDNKITFSIKKENVGVLPEGGVAIGALKGKIGEDDYTLFSDLGYVTNDLALFKGTALIGKVASPGNAGSILEANVMNSLDDEGYIVSADSMVTVMRDGLTKKNKTDVDVSSIVTREKKHFAQNVIKDDILKFLRLNQLVPSQIQNFVPIGASYNQNTATGSMITFVTEAAGLKESEICILADDLRYVNLEQTSVYTKALLKRAKKEMGIVDNSAVS